MHTDDGGDGDGDVGEYGVDEDAPHVVLMSVMIMAMNSHIRWWRIQRIQPSERETRAPSLQPPP